MLIRVDLIMLSLVVKVMVVFVMNFSFTVKMFISVNLIVLGLVMEVMIVFIMHFSFIVEMFFSTLMLIVEFVLIIAIGTAYANNENKKRYGCFKD
jgi:hypothetical protein